MPWAGQTQNLWHLLKLEPSNCKHADLSSQLETQMAHAVAAVKCDSLHAILNLLPEPDKGCTLS